MNEINHLDLSVVLSGASTRGELADALFQFMRQFGGSFYDESVTQLDHALQAARLARRNQATPEQVTAALLHDIGHFLMDEHDEQNDFLAEDWFHETVGAEQLEPFVGREVTEPIRLHVPAKRYLCTVDSDYFDSLSPASQHSFRLQGGGMTEREVAEFESHPFHATAVMVRRWDDGAKVAGLETPDLEAYRTEVTACLMRD